MSGGERPPRSPDGPLVDPGVPTSTTVAAWAWAVCGAATVVGALVGLALAPGTLRAFDAATGDLFDGADTGVAAGLFSGAFAAATYAFLLVQLGVGAGVAWLATRLRVGRNWVRVLLTVVAVGFLFGAGTVQMELTGVEVPREVVRFQTAQTIRWPLEALPALVGTVAMGMGPSSRYVRLREAARGVR